MNCLKPKRHTDSPQADSELLSITRRFKEKVIELLSKLIEIFNTHHFVHFEDPTQMHARPHPFLFAVFFHFLLLSTVQATTQTTLRQTQLWTEGTGWNISGSAITSSDLETSPTGNVLVWQAHDIYQKWVNIDMDGIAGSDWRDFDTVELVIESELATGAQINLQIASTGPNSGGDYYLYSFFVDWTGKKIFRLNLFDDFVKYRSPDGLSSITNGMISSSGWGANPVAGTVLRIHKLELKKTLAGRELRDLVATGSLTTAR